MGTITGYTAERMKEIEDSAVVDGSVVGNDLILSRNIGTTINAGNVRGPIGPRGFPGFEDPTFSEWWENRPHVFVPCLYDGTDQIGVIRAFVDGLAPGTVLEFPNGPIGLSEPWVPDKMLGVLGAGGRFGSRFIDLTGGSTDPLIDFDWSVDSGDGVWGNYGSWISDIAISRPEGSGPCLRVSPTSPHFEGRRLFMQGGTQSLDIRGGNAHFDTCLLWGATDCFINILQSGLELDITNTRMARNTSGTTAAYFKVTITTGGSYGGLYMDNVWGNCAQEIGGHVTRPFEVIASTISSLKAFLRQVILDNCENAALLTLISNFRFTDGYINCAAGTGNAAVKFDGCVTPMFRRNDLYGGASGSTFEFVGATTDTPILEQNLCPTGPVYKISTANKPVNPYIDDITSAAAIETDITNDVTWLRRNGGKRWGMRNMASPVNQTQVPIIAYPMVFEGTMGAGTVTLPAAGILAAYSRIIPFRIIAAGTLGNLSVSINEAGQEVTIFSSSASEVSTVGYFRYDIPH